MSPVRENRAIAGLSAYESRVIKSDKFDRTSTPSASPTLPRHRVAALLPPPHEERI